MKEDDGHRLGSSRLQDLFETFGEDRDVSLMLVAVGLFRGHKLVRTRTERILGPLGLTLPRYEVLSILDDATDGEMSLRDLKRASLLHAATMTYTIDGLQARGLITRSSADDDGDRRIVTARITSAGHELAGAALEALRAERFGLGGSLAPAEADELASLLSRIH
jgi:DNA-binding MarR family transcriptional regulator